MRIHELYQSGLERNPGKEFVTFPNHSSYTYEAFAERIAQTAHALESIGVSKGDRVSVFLPNCPTFLALFFATSKLGAVLAPANPEYTDRELSHSIDLSNPSILITEDELIETASVAAEESSVEEVLTIEKNDSNRSLSTLIEDQPRSYDAPTYPDSNIALHMYTSGTTGPPKAVEITHFNYTHAAADFAKRMGLAPSDRLGTCLPLFHANSQVYSTLGACAVGASLVLFDQFSTSSWWEWMREHNVTEFNAMGSMLKMLDNVDPSTVNPDNPVEKVFSAGTPPELIEPFEERFGIRVVEGYSLTEDVLLILNPTEPSRRRVGSIGLPPAEKRVQIVDDDGNQVPRGEKGEIIMDCPSTMAGYHDQPEKTDETIRDGWLYTGDYGRMDEDGFLYFVDRKKDVVRRSGENISSYEVEGVIKAMAEVEEVAIIPSPDEFRGEEVKALVKLEPGASLDPEDIIEAAEAELASFKVPRYVEFVDTFPYTPTEKIQKSKLREREQRGEVDHWDRTEELDG
ncbi:AMP-binding protein [Natronomonas halophila]|uniref:class I adenylate-forming enzyme family protein n=1 Tax=Natronomonas halophila TaxID=2747817 RepID=UPI0015B4D2E4|nr:AMP-binding protein [Natronomonas halophila]QLD86141.1 AMP-binding protein [Natronomonas halophila]